jgi:hypothetical protein
MYKKILAVGAHPDDVELGCLGTLLKFKDQGAKFDIVVARNDNVPRPSVWREREKMIQEYQSSENKIGVKFHFLENPLDNTGRPVLEWNSKTVEQLDNYVCGKDYDLVITHSPGDHHQDHVNTFNIVNSSLRRYQGELWCMEGGPYSNRNREFVPNVFVDISNYIDAKIDAIKSYDSYFKETLLHNITGQSALRGQMLGAKYAEAFEVRYRCIK